MWYCIVIGVDIVVFCMFLVKWLGKKMESKYLIFFICKKWWDNCSVININGKGNESVFN